MTFSVNMHIYFGLDFCINIVLDTLIMRPKALKIGTADVGSNQWWCRLHNWADVIHADSQTVRLHYLQNISNYLFCTSERMFSTVIMQNSRLLQAFLLIKIVQVWIDQYCFHYDWWCRPQLTLLVSSLCWWRSLVQCLWSISLHGS